MAHENVRSALREAVEAQARDGTPPATTATLERLQAEGASRADAVDAIAVELLAELNEIARTREPFNEARYSLALARLRCR